MLKNKIGFVRLEAKINMRYILPAFLLCNIIGISEALRILVWFPLGTKSHNILGHGVVDRLLEAHHEVVHITSFPKEKAVPNLTEICVSAGKRIKEQYEKTELFKLKNVIGKSNMADTYIVMYISYLIQKSLLEETNVIKLLSDPKEKFDVVILEWFFSELQAGIPHLFEAPMIWFCSTEPHWQTMRLVDEIPNPAYNTDMYNPRPLGFWERVDQLWRVVKKYTIVNFIQMPAEWWEYNNIYPEIAAKRGITVPSYSDAVYNGSLMLLNSHPSFGGAMRLPQNAINVAGYHIKDKIEPLPKNLQTIMDAAKNGVIYFSLGTYMKSDGMSDEMKQSLLKMFSKLDQTIIWKFESDMENPAPNVHLVKWAPQPSILAHPNLKVFITHGGQLSTTEAVHFGVPLVGIPIIIDQYINMASVESKGFGIIVNLAEDMADELNAAIRKVLTDEKYTTKAKEVSAIFHDRPMKPGASLAYWVEHVARTRGAPHLRSSALTVSLYQRIYLDLLAFVILVTICVLQLYKYVMKMRTKKTSKKSKKQ